MGVASSALVGLLLLYTDPILLTGPIVPKDPDKRPEYLRYQLGLRAEVRSGHPLGFNTPGTSGPARTDGEVNPSAGFQLPMEGGGLTLAYEPRIFFVASSVASGTEGQEGRHVSYLHRGRLTFEWQPSERWKLFVNGRAAYGEYDFSPLTTVIPGAPAGIGNPGGGTGVQTPTTSPTLPIPGPGTPPDQRLLAVVELNAGAGLVHAFSPNLSWLLSGGYLRRGGSTPEAREALPLQKGPQAATGLQWTLSPLDAWTMLASGSSASFSTGAHATFIDLTGTWSHGWSRAFQTDLTGGASGFHSSGVPTQGGGVQPTVDKVLPVAALSLTHRVLQQRGDVINVLQLRVAPLADQLNGSVYERFEAVLMSAIPVAGQLWMQLTGGMSMAVSGPELDARVEGTLSYRLAPQLSVSIGGRTAWLRGADPGAGVGFGWVGFLNVSGALTGQGL